MRRENAHLIYRAVFLPKLLYGVELWHKAATSRDGQKILLSLQMSVILAITSANKTASSDCLPVIAGILPLDLEDMLQATRISSRREPNFALNVENKKQELIKLWQERWTASNKAPWTHKLIPDVNFRMNITIWTNHHLSQILTGHGNFRAKLFSLQSIPQLVVVVPPKKRWIMLCFIALEPLINTIISQGHPSAL